MKPNWKPIVYQIYIKSFFAHNNKSGIGDLKGIISKLDYLKNLGINYLWITPFFKSDFKDNGYDVIDYYSVDPKFGTNQDLVDLIQEAEKRDINIMLDMVFNHTSVKSSWFLKWKNGDPKYRDFYISKYSENRPPNNWVSKFGDNSVWKQYKKNYWYLHLFDQSQADLNWENPQVRKELKKVIDYYLSIGIKGFRFDVINLISKKGFYNSKINQDGREFYTDGPCVLKYFKEITSSVPKEKPYLTIGELSSTSIEKTIEYTSDKDGFNAVFNFHHLKVDYKKNQKFVNKKPNIKLFNKVLNQWFTKVNNESQGHIASFLNNHDQPRSISRFIQNQKLSNYGAKMLFGLTSSLPGLLVIYQGEEIGMENADFQNIKQYKDVETINFYKNNSLNKVSLGIKQKSRDNSRTPFQWNNQKWSGFSTIKPWIDVNNNYKNINVQNQEKDIHSILNFYINQMEFIKNNFNQTQEQIQFLKFRKNVIAFEKIFNKKTFKIICSFNDKKIKYSFNKNKVIKSNYENKDLQSNVLLPYQFLIIEN